MLWLATLVLVLLHGPEDHDILVNPDMVTTMRAASGEDNRYLTKEARCMINTSDGKYVSVVETCEEVRELFKEARP